MQVIEVSDGKSALCAEILSVLPDWFGIPDANARYALDVAIMPVFAVSSGGRPIGFLALHQHKPHAVEIHVLGVRSDGHRKGVGRARVNLAHGAGTTRA